jgi:SnoaL-like protein
MRAGISAPPSSAPRPACTSATRGGNIVRPRNARLLLAFKKIRDASAGVMRGEIMPEVLRGRLTMLYAAMKKGQLDFVLNAIHDDIEFISYSPTKVFPFLGHRRGKPAMAESLHGAVEAFEILACEPISMVVEPESAAVMVFTARRQPRDRPLGAGRARAFHTLPRRQDRRIAGVHGFAARRRTGARSRTDRRVLTPGRQLSNTRVKNQ